MSVIVKIKAAIAAFKDPELVREAQEMRETLAPLCASNEFVLLGAELFWRKTIPIITTLSFQERQDIRRILQNSRTTWNRSSGMTMAMRDAIKGL